MCAAALGFAWRGWPVIPIALDRKAPLVHLVPHGVAHATCDPDVIRYWWARWPSANIAIACHSLLVVDVDPRNGGDRNIKALLDEHGPFPVTPTQKTGGGGLHYLFKRPTSTLPVKLIGGVDLIHGPRKYIVAAPSSFSHSRNYEWLTPPTTSLAAPPDWLVNFWPRGKARPSQATAPQTVDPSSRLKRATAYARRIPPAVSGQGGHDHTFLTACRIVRGFLLNADEAYAVMCEWNRTCQPPWSEHNLRRKIDHALKYGRMPFGALLEETTR